MRRLSLLLAGLLISTAPAAQTVDAWLEGIAAVTDLADGRIALLDDDGIAASLRLYSASGESQGVLFSTSEYVNAGLQLRDGRLVLGSRDGAVVYSLGGEVLGPLAEGVGSWRGIVELQDGRLLVANAGRVDVVSGIATDTDDAPEAGSAVRVAPNPTRTTAVLTFRLDAPAVVRFTLHDALGREVVRLADGPLAAGEHRADLDARGLASGVYLWRLSIGERTQSGTVTVVR
ncbi:MAG: T9SS type A sorting domain-containing protein [Bacteroidota bacterium]